MRFEQIGAQACKAETDSHSLIVLVDCDYYASLVTRRASACEQIITTRSIYFHGALLYHKEVLHGPLRAATVAISFISSCARLQSL